MASHSARGYVARRLGGLVACDLAVLVGLVADGVLQLLDERSIRDRSQPGLVQRGAVLVGEPRSATIDGYRMKIKIA